MKLTIFLSVFLTIFSQDYVLGEPQPLIFGWLLSTAPPKFYLYTRLNPEKPQLLPFNNTESLLASNFNPKWPTRIIIHGFRNDKESYINQIVTPAYLKKGDFNVIFVDWSKIGYASLPEYPYVADKVPFVGKYVGEFTKFLNRVRGVPFNEMYLIGHSLGAHVAGFAGKTIAPEKYHTIFALDPAGPNFKDKFPNGRLTSNDAKYVETINTDTRFGFHLPLGHANFYPKITECTGKISFLSMQILKDVCEHSKAYILFAQSILQDLIGKECKTYENVEKEKCNSPKPRSGKSVNIIKMGGEPSSANKRGLFYVAETK